MSCTGRLWKGKFVNLKYLNSSKTVGVGIMFAHNPLHGSGRAEFPHPALALGEDAHATQGIRMIGTRRGQPASYETSQAFQGHSAFLAATRKRAIPVPTHLESKGRQ